MPYVLGKCTFYFNTGSEGDIERVRIKQVEFSENARLYFPRDKANDCNRPFCRYGGHIQLIRFKEYYRMTRGHEYMSFVFSV